MSAAVISNTRLKRIRLLRESVDKIARVLTGKQITVRQAGSQAYVIHDERTLQATLVNIPVIPDDASDLFLDAIQGFLDHEVAHVLFTDPKIAIEASKRGKHEHFNWNVIEDCFIERKMAQKFEGSAYNLSRTRQLYIERIMKVLVQKYIDEGKTEESDWWNVLAVPSVRALAGQSELVDFMDQNKLWDKIPNVKRVLDSFGDAFKTTRNSEECFELGLKLKKALMDKRENPTGDSCDDPNAESSDDGKPSNEPGLSNNEDNTTDDLGGDESDDKGDGDESSNKKPNPKLEDLEESKEDGDSGDDSEDEGESDDESEDQEEQSEDESEESDDAPSYGEDEIEESKDSGDEAGDSDESEGSDDNEDEEDFDDEAGDSDESEDEDEDSDEHRDADEDEGENDEGSESEGDEGEEPEESEGSSEHSDEAPETTDGDEIDPDHSTEPLLPEDKAPPPDFDKMIEVALTDIANQELPDSQYEPFCTSWDKIETYKPTEESGAPEEISDIFERVEQKTKDLVGVMQRQLERAFIAMNKASWDAGKRMGRIAPHNLSRLMAGDDRVFRTRSIRKTKDVAVGLLIDCSGSMSGQKMYTAMTAAWALCDTLTRLKIPNEVIGFTTLYWGLRDDKNYEELMERYNNDPARGLFARIVPLWMPIFKEFGEHFGVEQKRRMAAFLKAHQLAENVDGECVRIAADRLLKRPEPGKTLIVLSDGQPLGCVSASISQSHLKFTTRNVEKLGVNLVGIGICDSSVRHYYRKQIVLHKVEDLAGAVIAQLRETILQR